MHYYMIGKIVTNSDGSHIRNASIRQYSYAPAMTSVITDYIVATHSSAAGPFIIGKLNIDTDAKKNIISKSITGNLTFDKLKIYQSIFPDGFIIDSNCTTEAEINTLLNGNLKVTGSKVLWNVRF